MVTTDISQLAGECSSWREHLRSDREELSRLTNQLQQVSGGMENKEILTEVEHYHNQFYIQQINIHDLKQAIKSHERRVEMGTPDAFGKLTQETLQEHELLLDQYRNLENTIKTLKHEFNGFVTKVLH